AGGSDTGVGGHDGSNLGERERAVQSRPRLRLNESGRKRRHRWLWAYSDGRIRDIAGSQPVRSIPPDRMWQAVEQLGSFDNASTSTRSLSVGDRRLLPALVREVPSTRQARRHSDRLRSVLYSGAPRLETSGKRQRPTGLRPV